MVKRVYLMFFDQIHFGTAYSILSSYNVHIIRLLGKSFCHNAKMFINNKDFHGPWQFISAASGFTREYYYTSSLTFFCKTSSRSLGITSSAIHLPFNVKYVNTAENNEPSCDEI